MAAVDMLCLTSAQAGALAPDAIGLIPLGALEQHGPHLPLGTDMLIARALAERVADELPCPVVLVPTPVGGLSDHHVAFAGTVTLRGPTLEATLDEMLAGLDRMGVRRAAVFSAHGGNFAFLRRYAASRSVEVFSDLPRWFETSAAAARAAGLSVLATDQHAGLLETSQALALFPHLVGDFTELIGYDEVSSDWQETFWEKGVGVLSANGILGDPRGANARTGDAINAALTSMLAQWLHERFGLRGDTPVSTPER